MVNWKTSSVKGLVYMMGQSRGTAIIATLFGREMGEANHFKEQ